MDNQAQWIESLNDKVRTADLTSKLEQYHANIKVLSLDCFDTLIWRKTATPTDLFFALQKKPTFQSLGFSALLRSQAEKKARQIKQFKQQGHEVTLEDIYREYNPSFSAAEIEALTQEELATESENCYAFPPIVNLIRKAHQLGIKVILVSDTYLTELQLRQLLTQALPSDVMQMIAKICCSSAYQCTKTHGLFAQILKTLPFTAAEILHIGDNYSADYVAARALKLNALHFLPEDERITDLLRLQAIAASIADTTIRNSRPFFSPFRGVFASTSLNFDKPGTFLGYASLGPLMYAFARFICDEVEQMRLAGKQPKVLFLMRDGYLPALACETLMNQTFGHRVRISRFAAYAASFRTEEDIDRYLITIGKSNRFHDIARQLLLPDKVAEPIIKVAQRSVEPEEEFNRQIHRKDILRIIFNKSADYSARLKKYLEREVGLKAGDTLVFVDLGYNGTVQRQLTPLFNAMKVEVAGRYLISLRTPNWQAQRRGLLDPSWCDDNIMQMLVSHISMLEQLCTANESSSVGYDQAGNILYTDVIMSDQQQSTLSEIQKNCIAFIKEAKLFFDSIQTSIPLTILRENALAELSRMLFLQTAPELQALQAFQFDVNMGTKDVYQLFDPAQGLIGLKRRGLFYTEKNSNKMRTNYPAELRTAGFELALTSMIQNRLGLDIKLRDMLQRQELLPAILTQAQQRGRETLEASATHDGYFSVWAPVGTELLLLLGQKYQWLQIESAELIPVDAFIQQTESYHVIDAWPYLTFESMADKGNGLFECTNEASAIIIRPGLKHELTNTIFRLVYRPIIYQTIKPQKQISSFKAAFSISV